MLISEHGQQTFSTESAFPVLHVLGNIDDDRAGATRPREFECRPHRRFEPLGVGDKENVFGDGAHDADDRRLLERVGADGCRCDLTTDYDDGNRVGHAIADRRHAVGCAWTRCHDGYADFSGSPGVAGGHETRALFVRRNDEWHRVGTALSVRLVVAKNRVVGRQNCAAAIAEDRLDAFVREDLNDHIGTGHHGTRLLVRAIQFGLDPCVHGGLSERRAISLLLDRIYGVFIRLVGSFYEKFVHCNRRCSRPTFIG